MPEIRRYRVLYHRDSITYGCEQINEVVVAYDAKDAGEQVRIKDEAVYPPESRHRFRCTVRSVEPVALA